MKSQQEYMKNVSTIYPFSQFQLNFHSMSFLFLFICLSHSKTLPHRYDLLNQSMRKQRCFFMQVGQQRAPVADCFHRRSYLFMLSHFHFSDMIVFLTHQPFIIQKSSNIHFFCHNPFHGIFRWNNSVQYLPQLLNVKWCRPCTTANQNRFCCLSRNELSRTFYQKNKQQYYLLHYACCVCHLAV